MTDLTEPAVADRRDGVHGTVAPRFEPVRAVFAEGFRARGELGASLCVWHRGELVVDLWGGLRDRDERGVWDADTLGTVFSATKGILAICLLMLADRGELDHDARVAHYWPEFAANGKGEITVRQLLNHRSGLSAIDRPLTLDDLESPERLAAAIVAQRPLFPPGTDQAYGAIAFGITGGELFRRVAGESAGTFLAREVAGPLDAEVYLGLPEELEPRVATLYPVARGERLRRIPAALLSLRSVEGRIFRRALVRGTVANRAFRNPKELGPFGLGNFNLPRVHRMELPWANAIASARGLARIYAALLQPRADGGLVRPETLALVRPRGSESVRDLVMQKPLGFALGFVKDEPHLFSKNPAAFGHPGAGGSLGWADPDAGLAIGYVMNRMDFHVRSPRAVALCHAVNGCV